MTMRRRDDPRLDDRAAALARRLAALPEPAMRRRALRRALATLDPREAVRLLEVIRWRGRRGGPPFDVALMALARAVTNGDLPYDEVAALYREARQAALTPLAELLLGRLDGTAPSSRPADPDRPLTLGHRKSLARSRDRTVLDGLLRAPEPDVVRILLENPRLTEADVVRLVARRPADPAVQREVFASGRWMCRTAVRRALVLNPWTPGEIALRLIHFLDQPDLNLVARSPGLPEGLRRAAVARIAERRGS